jgi:hypothetical protein
MKPKQKWCLLLALIAAVSGSARADDVTIGPLQISKPWTRVVPEASKVSAGFMRITNTGKEADTLLSGSADIAEKIEIHEMTVTGGMMRMRELKPGLVIKPGETVELKPGSFHVMFMGLKALPKQGQPVKGTLVFEKAGSVAITYDVEPFGTRTPGDGGQPMMGGKGSGSGSGAMKP